MGDFQNDWHGKKGPTTLAAFYHEKVAERDAEIEFLKIEIDNRNDDIVEYRRALGEQIILEEVYQAFVEFVDAELPKVFTLDYDHSDSDWRRWAQAREQLRGVIDGMD